MARILVYDREPKRLCWYGVALQHHTLAVVTNLSSALQRVQRARYNLVLVDWFRSDGPEFLEEWRRLPQPPRVPVYLTEDGVIQSLAAMSEQARQLGSAGFLYRHPKPGCFEQLVNAALSRAGIPVQTVLGTAEPPAQLRVSVSPRVTPRSDKLARIIADSPLARMARQIGGWQALNAIMKRHGIRPNHARYERFTEMLNNWAIMDPLTRYVAVLYATEDLRKEPDDPVNAALIEVAEALAVSMTKPA